MAIPLFATRDSLEPLLPAVADRMRAVIEAGHYILGPEVEAFESEFAAYLGVRHCIGVANGTDALTIALRAAGVGDGDEVVLPAVSFYATAESVVHAGARPVFADVDPQTWCITAATVEPVLTERTAAIVPVHLFGNSAPVGELRELAESTSARPIRIVEDAAQAAGASLNGEMAGALGSAAAFSFYPSKNLGGFGDGGAITTDDPDIAAQCRTLRAHGSTDKRVHDAIGYNSRLDELQAAALRVLLPELDGWNEARRSAAETYRALGLEEFMDIPVETAGARSCYHLYVIASPMRDELSRALTERSVGNRVYYTPPLYRQPGISKFTDGRELTGADRFAAESLALPMGPDLQTEQVEQVVDAIRQSLGSGAAVRSMR